jgi:hypothetical protein
MVAMTVRAGLIPEQVQGTIEGLSGRRRGPVGRSGGHRRRSQLFERSRMFLGPLPIGPAPRLILR